MTCLLPHFPKQKATNVLASAVTCAEAMEGYGVVRTHGDGAGHVAPVSDRHARELWGGQHKGGPNHAQVAKDGMWCVLSTECIVRRLML